MIWVNCLFGLLIFNAISCTPEISHEKSFRIQRQIPGGAVDKDPNDPKYYDLAQLAMKKYARGSNQAYVVLQVTRATEQVVAGLITKIEFYVQSTSCQYCQRINTYNLMTCQATISEQSWLLNRDISVNCDPLTYK